MKAIELEKAYDPKSFEDRIYAEWENKGYFKPDFFISIVPFQGTNQSQNALISAINAFF